jgi:hypothetical protein
LKKLSPLFVIPLMLLFALVNPISVHASTGLVSINGGQPVISAQTDTAVSVPIYVSGGNSLNAFDIQVKADPTILQAASVSLSGSILTSASIVLECMNGVLVAGTVCSAQDGSGVVHLAAAQTGALIAPPASPGLGLLFTINYNIIGHTSSTPISFNTGCTTTSVSNGDCVSLGNGSTILNPETDQGTTFANLIDFSLTAQFASLSTPPGVMITDTMTITSLGGYTDVVAFTCSASAGQSCNMSPTSATLNPGSTASSVLTVSGTMSGPVTVNATGTGACLCPIQSHVKTIGVTIAAPDFTTSLSSSSVTVPRGGTNSAVKVNLAGNSGFSGTVTITSPGDAGITATAPMATLTPDGSGFSAASSTLTVTVASTTTLGDHPITITGTVGTTSHSATLTVTVPNQNYTIFAVPNAITIVRGGSAAANINLFSLGNFAATVSFTATTSPVAGQQDSCCLTNNITPAFSPATVALPAGGSASVAFFAATIGGAAPAATYTSTGNYTATVTATAAGITQSVTIFFTVQDFSLLQSFCDASTSANPTFVNTSPDANQDPAGLGSPCDTLTITTESGLQDPGGLPNQNVLWVQTGAFGGLVTDGFNGTPSVAALNPQIDPRGSTVPALASVLPGNPKFGPIPLKMCLLQTFWPNGTQIPYSYLRANGPLISPGVGLYAFLSELNSHDIFSSNFGMPIIPIGLSNWGCKFDAQAFPNDQGNPELNAFEMAACDHDPLTGHCTDSDKAADIAATGTFDTNECVDIGCPFPTVNNNPDFLTITGMTIPGKTLPGAYTFKLCGQIGVLVHCNIYHLDVILPPLISDLHWDRSASVSHNRPVMFGVGMYNPDTLPLYFQAVISATADNGNSFTVSSAVVLIQPGTVILNTKIFSPTFTAADIGATYSFTVTILAGATATGLTASSSDVTLLFAGSGLNSGSVVIKP